MLARIAVLGLLATATISASPAIPGAVAYPATTITVTGHGWGHGRGLGQWGAFGFATRPEFSWSFQQILARYYSNASLSTQPNDAITVRLMAREGLSTPVTSGGGMHVGGFPVAAGSAAWITADPGNVFSIHTAYGCDQPEVWTTQISDPTIVPDVADPGNDLTKMLEFCGSPRIEYRGAIRIAADSAGQHTVNVVSMEDYLRGVVPRESPASWGDVAGGKGMNALYAQAIAVRSYAWAENRTSYAKTCDTTSCQVYGGAGQDGTRIEDNRTDAAVAATAGQVMRMNSDNSIARTEFSSSTGGYTAGGTFPAVPDEGDVASPYHDWSTTLSVANIESAYGVGSLSSIAVTSRNGLGADGGRALTVVITGASKSVSVSGASFAASWGLRSNWFVFQPPAAPGPQWFVRTTPDAGPATSSFAFGGAKDITIACDWFGQGFDTPGVFRGGQWFLSNDSTGSTVDANFRFGDAGDTPLCGDWDGNGTDTVAVWRAGTFYLNNSNDGSAAKGVFGFGNPTDVPIAGNWNADPWDSVGVDRKGTFFLANSNLSPSADIVFAFGDATDRPVVGDWDGNGIDTIGVRRGGTFYLSDNPASGAANRVITFGDPGDRPIIGHWAASPAASGIGVTR